MRFPMFVELEGRKAVVFGAGTIATRRIRALREFGACVTVIAPLVSEAVEELGRAEEVLIERRKADRKDLEDAFLVVAATDDREVNHQIYEWCRDDGVLVNVADKKEECSFYFPGLAKAGNLTAGVCAGGKDHRLAKQAAEDIRRLFKERYEDKE